MSDGLRALDGAAGGGDGARIVALSFCREMPMSDSILVEACVDSVASATAAQAGGAQRVEVCADLFEGGLTPSAGMIRQIRERLQIRLHVLIRPRAADFCYDADELAVMAADIDMARKLGADGVVLGVLLPDGCLDRQQTARLAERARPLAVTFHRAIDVAREPLQVLDQLIELGLERVLTSGQEETALAGMETIAALVERAAGRIAVMAAGGIDERNVERVVAGTGVREVHATLRAATASRMTYRAVHCGMGGALRPAEFGWSTTSKDRVEALRAAL